MPDPIAASLCAIEKNVQLTEGLYKYLKKSFENECISDFMKGFYKYFYDNGYDYDINGFCLVFFVPPHLSGFNWPTPDLLLSPSGSNSLGLSYLDFITFALEITPSDISVEKGTLGIVASDTFDYPINVHATVDVSLSYLDTSDLKLYSFHSMWVRYIHAVISGISSPIDEYLDADVDFDIIDYLGSLYILKFDADMLKPRMIAKALGIFPNGVPFKEQIGPKGQHQITISNASYTCSYFYEEHIPENSIENPLLRTVLFKEFMNRFEPIFETLLSPAIDP